MRRLFPLVVLSILMYGCPAYKELSPDPELSPAERGYVELKNDEEHFTLDKDGKYFIKFPKPERDRFNLVLSFNSKNNLRYFLTDKFDGGEGPFARIKDEMEGNDTLSAYAINTSGQEYYLVIDSVLQDLTLMMKYRYVPEWRFAFENKYAEYSRILRENLVDRTTYNMIDQNFDLSNIRFAEEIGSLETRTKSIRSMNNDLVKLEQLFPPGIASSRDTAYQNFVALRNQTTDELRFQENYGTVLKVFKLEQDSHGNPGKFLDAAPEFADFMSNGSRYRQPIVDKAKEMFLKRLTESQSYFDNQLRAKNDAKPVAFKKQLDNGKKLYASMGMQPSAEFTGMSAFVDRFNVEAAAVQSANEKFRQIDHAFDANPPWLSEALYADLVAKVGDIKADLPQLQSPNFEKYGRYTCTSLLEAEVRNAAARADASQVLFQSGQEYVQHLNANQWSSAEQTLRRINATSDAIPAVMKERRLFVRAFEDELFNRVKQLSFQRVDAFVKANEASIDNVPQLYLDSAFIPVHQIGFAAAGEAAAQRKREEIQKYIDNLKYRDFPAASIRAIYRDLTANISSRGVERARAIVAHGKYYRGDDKQLRSMVNECDPAVAKWIIKPKDYRKLYALPVTTNPRGTNEYVFRVLLKIPSEAQFPVYEINIKLPKEVAEKAGSQSWYQSITINKKPIKNEGRFTITAPREDNNYESQVSPVQMDKAGNNVLEVRFKAPTFKVYEVSTMAQVPIIRKN
ncbi:MAG: hypothetical protein HY961_02880 [Ignavibacteriae bacterium]|nr:hypothetical protein [Ignavibacteriota bacterium]